MNCLTCQDPNVRELFLALPDLLYKADSPQSKETERQLLSGTHPLSENMKLYPFVVTEDGKTPLCRGMLTCYEGDTTGYVGFFESVEDDTAAILLLNTIRSFGERLGLTELMGPIDCSIYLGYRFRTDSCRDHFTGEPHHKPYYPHLWEKAGYCVCARYASYRLDRVSAADSDEKLERILQRCLQRGFTFCSLEKKEFEPSLKQIYELLNRRYSGFSGFKPITCEQFGTMFRRLKKIADFGMVKLAYLDGELKGFCICLPNYGTLTLGKMTPLKLLRLLKLRRKAREYVVLYLGADEKCIGLGSALVHYLQKEIHRRQCTSIAALIKENEVSNRYYSSKHIDRHSYALYTKNL